MLFANDGVLHFLVAQNYMVGMHRKHTVGNLNNPRSQQERQACIIVATVLQKFLVKELCVSDLNEQIKGVACSFILVASLRHGCRAICDDVGDLVLEEGSPPSFQEGETLLKSCQVHLVIWVGLALIL